MEPNGSFSIVTTMDSFDYDDPEFSWKEKYEMADAQLEKFRKQAGKVRELLGKKMNEYEERVISAEKKRDEALEKIEKLDISVQDKDEAISALREKISRLRDEKISFMVLDDEKMKKIKEWVKVKFTELFQELERVKIERDRLKKDYEKDHSRASEYSIGHNYYEEIFGELLEDLRDSSSYERISTYLRKQSGTPDIPTEGEAMPEPPPEIPPRRSSIREESRLLNSSRPKPMGPTMHSSSPNLVHQMFDLPTSEEAGPGPESLQLLNDEMKRMSQDGQAMLLQRQESTFREPTSPLYFTLQSMVNGIEFENHRNSTPVYSTLAKGKERQHITVTRLASIIREEPFSGETSDSEIDGEQETLTANNLPSKEHISNSKESSPSMSRQIFRTCASFTEQNMRKETLMKAGWLTKLGGRVKNWKRRWFTLIDGKLSYHKSRSDMYRKPLGWIEMKSVTQIKKSSQPITFEICTPERTYYLTAETNAELNDWMRVLNNAMRRFTGARLLSKAGEKTIYAGWVTKAKCGLSKPCWAVLKEKNVLFYKTDIEMAPIGAISLREIISVTPVKDDVASNDTENYDNDGTCRLMIQCLKDTHPTYFVVSSRSEMELWLHHLQQMCSSGDINNETGFEQIVTKLMNIDGDTSSRYWRSKFMIHSKNILKESLTSLPTIDLEKEAINLFKSVQLFSTTPINETAIDYHIALSQDIIQLCLTHPELQTEIYCQLIKQTSKYRSKPNTPASNFLISNDWITRSSSYGTVDQQPVSAFVYMQCWQLIALCTSIFLPKLKILWLLKAHLQRNASECSDIGRYAIYCQRSLERTLKIGEREMKPSRLEAISLIARNPYFRIFPMSIPVYFINNSYQLFSFDGSTTVSEFTSRINEEVGIRDNLESGFSLFTDNPVAQVEHCLQSDLKLCDVISKWEQAAQQLKTGRFERSKAIKLTYKNRLLFKSLLSSMTEKEKLLHVFQINDSLQIGHLIASPSVLSKLTALLAQIEFGDYVDNFKLLEDIILKIYPNYSYMEEVNAKKKIMKGVADSWSKLKGRLLKECIASYLTIAQTIRFYGCKLFKAQEKLQQSSNSHQNVWLVVEEEKIQIVSKDMEVLCSYNWPNIVTFGGFKEDFMLVVQIDDKQPEKTNRYLFAMPSGRVLEVTLLIASYINAVVTRCGFNLDCRSRASSITSESNVKQMNSTLRNDNHLWDMESDI